MILIQPGGKNGKTTGSEEFMTKERIEKELSKVDAQLESLQAKKKDLEEQKRMAERAEKMDIIEKHKISSEKLQLLINFEVIGRKRKCKGDGRK